MYVDSYQRNIFIESAANGRHNKKLDMRMDYAYTYPNAIIRYKASDMQIYVK